MQILFLMVLIFLIRLLPRLIRPEKRDTDTWYHISSVASIAKNNYKIPDCNRGFILKGKYDYPHFAHWIVALFVKNNILTYERFIGPIIDTIYIITSYLYFLFYMDFYHIENGLQSIGFLLLATFSITMLKISTGPRIYSFTPRVLGEFFVFIYFASLHVYSLNDNIYVLFTGIIFGGLAFNTSKFAAQIILIISILLSILLKSYTPLVFFICSLLLALIFSKGHYLNIASQHLKHLIQYASYGQFNHSGLKTKNKFSQYIKFFKHIFLLNFDHAYRIFQTDLIFFNVLYKNFDVILALLVLYFIGINDVFLNTLFTATMILFFFTSFKPFLFLGESDRYLDYLIIFSIVILSTTLTLHEIALIITLEIFFYALTLLVYIRSSNNYGAKFLDTMHYINKNIQKKENYVVHAILGQAINYPLTVLTNINSLTIEANYVFDLVNDKKLMPHYAVYTNNFDYLYHKYGVNIIVANKKYLHKDIMYDFSRFDVFYQNDEYVTYLRKEIS